ncbi:hypothetical protein X975_15046, partial [Stegodyphus mimosarum]
MAMLKKLITAVFLCLVAFIFMAEALPQRGDTGAGGAAQAGFGFSFGLGAGSDGGASGSAGY